MTRGDVVSPSTMALGAVVASLLSDPAVPAAIEACRAAYAPLRWHPAMRRRTEEVHAEVMVRAAAASAGLEGAPVSADSLRRTDVAAAASPDPALALAVGALRACLAVHRSGRRVLSAPLQVMAAAHVAAAGGLVPPDQLGRPRPGTQPRLQELARSLTSAASGPAPLLAAVTCLEIQRLDAFPPVSGVGARALARGVVAAGGLDPLDVGIPEAVALADREGAGAAAARWRSGEPGPAVAWWLTILTEGAAAGGAAAAAVLTGASG